MRRALLSSVLEAPLDDRVRDLIVEGTGGNPLALLELPRGLSVAELSAGFAVPAAEQLVAGSSRAFDGGCRRSRRQPAPVSDRLGGALADPSACGEPRGCSRRAEAARPAPKRG